MLKPKWIGPQGVLSTAIQSLMSSQTMIFHGLFSKRRANGRFMSHSGVISLSASDPTPRWTRRPALVSQLLRRHRHPRYGNEGHATNFPANQNGRDSPPGTSGFGLWKSEFRLGKTIGKPLTKLLHWSSRRKSLFPKVNGDRNVVLKCYELPHIWSVLRQLLIGT